MRGRDGMLMIMGLGKKKPAGPPMPEIGGGARKAPPFMKKAATGDTADNGGDPADETDPMAGGDDEESEKLSADKAGVTHADENCGNCKHYSEGDGSCEAVEGTFSPDDRCWAAYWPKNGASQDSGADTGVDDSGAGSEGGDYGTGPTS